MTDTMLEKMARSTYAKWIEDVRDLEPAWDDLPESHRARLIDATRAALMAIQEASQGMVRAAYETASPGFCDEPGDPLDPADVWDAMIDAILEGRA